MCATTTPADDDDDRDFDEDWMKLRHTSQQFNSLSTSSL
jgi:hypothetical protein